MEAGQNELNPMLPQFKSAAVRAENEKDQSEWIGKLRNILEAEIPIRNIKKVYLSSDKNKMKNMNYEDDNSSSDGDSDISFLLSKKQTQEEIKQKQKRDLYLLVGEKMNERDEHSDALSSNGSENNEQPQTPEDLFKLVNEELNQDYIKESMKIEQSKNLGIAEMNVFERIRAFDTTTTFRKVFKRFWVIQSNASLFCQKIVSSQLFENITLLVILLNCVILAMDDPTTQTDDDSRANLELSLLIFYTIEMGFKIAALGFLFNQGAYLRNGWNILDFIIIITGFLPYLISSEVNLNAIRSLRVLRPLRTISTIKSLKQILNTLFDSLPLLKDAIAILLFFYLIFAIAGQQLFSGSLKRRCFQQETGIQLGDDLNYLFLCTSDSDCPQGQNVNYICGKGMNSPFWDTENFDTFGWALLNVYVVVSQEGWTSTMTHIQQTFAIKYQENERLLKHRQQTIENEKIFSLDDFKKWGIYQSNKERFRKLEENRLKRMASTAEKLKSFFRNGANIAVRRFSKIFSKKEISQIQLNELKTKEQVIDGNDHICQQDKDNEFAQKQLPSSQASRSLIEIESTNKKTKRHLYGESSIHFDEKNKENKEMMERNTYLGLPKDLPVLEGKVSAIGTVGQSSLNQRINTRIFMPTYLQHDAEALEQLKKNSIRIKDFGLISYTQNVYIPKIHPIQLARHKNQNKILSDGKKAQNKDIKKKSYQNSLQIPNMMIRSVSKKATIKLKQNSAYLNQDEENQRRLKQSRGNTFIKHNNCKDEVNSKIGSDRELPPLGHLQSSGNRGSAQKKAIMDKASSSGIRGNKNKLNSIVPKSKGSQKQEIVIPSRKIESEDEDDEINLLELEDEEFMQKIEKIDEQNQKLLTALNDQKIITDSKGKNLKKNDKEIETQYKPKEIGIEMLIKQKETQQNFLEDFQTQTPQKMITNNDQSLLSSLPSLVKKSVSTQQPVIYKTDNIIGQRRSSGINSSGKQLPKMPNGLFASLQLNKSNSKKGDAQMTPTGARSELKNKQDSMQPIDKFKDIIFNDEDFYDFQNKKNLSQKSREFTIRSSDKKKSNQQGEIPQKKQTEQQQLSTPKNEAEKEVILKQVFSKDEGQLYRQLFANKPLIAKVLFTEPVTCSDDILPKENLIKRENRKQEMIERFKRIKFSVFYQANKRMKLKSKLLEEKRAKIEKNRKYPFKMSNTAADLIKQQVRVYDASILGGENKSINQEYINQNKNYVRPAGTTNDVFSNGTLSKSPNVILNAHNNQRGTPSFPDVLEDKLNKRKNTFNKKLSLFNIEMEKNNNSLQSQPKIPSLMLVDVSQSQGHPPSFEKPVEITPQSGNIDSISKQDKESSSPAGSRTNINQDNSKLKKVVKSILKQKTLLKNASFKEKLIDNNSNRFQQSQPVKKKGKKQQGDRLIYNWDIVNAMEKVFPAVDDKDNEFQGQEELSQEFKENLSIFTSILDQSKVNLSLNSSFASLDKSENASNNSSLSEQYQRSSASSYDNNSNNSGSYATLSTENDLNKKLSSGKVDSSKPSPRSSASSNSEGDKSQLDEDNEDGKDKESQKLEYFAREGIELEYAQTMKKQIKNLMIRGKIRIKEDWSGDNVLPSARISKSHHSTNVLLRSLNYSSYDTKLNIGGINGLRIAFCRRVLSFVQFSLYENSLMVCVIINTIILSLDGTSINEDLLNQFNKAFTYIFAVDMGLKLIGLGISRYVANKMNIFDAVIVALSIFDMVFLSGSSGGSSLSAFRSLRILRVFRVLRVTRLLRQLAFMKILVTVITSIAGKLVYISLLLLLYLFIFTLIGMQIYGGEFSKAPPTIRMNFDSFLEASYSVFDLLTIENWNDILEQALRTSVNLSITIIYLISCIFIGNFIIMNLVLATMINAFNSNLFDREKQQIIQQVDVVDDLDTLNQSSASSLLNSSLLSSSATMIRSQNTLQAGKSSVQQQTTVISSDIGSNPSSGNNNGKINKITKPVSDGNSDKQSENESESQHSQSISNANKEMKELKLAKSKDNQQKAAAGEEDQDKEKVNLFESIACRQSLYMFSFENKLRQFCYVLLKHRRFESLILLVIVLNSLKLIVDTYFNQNSTSGAYPTISNNVDIFFSVFFTMESLIKIISQGLILDEGSYLRDSWSQLDFFVVVTSLIDVSNTGVDLGAIKILRLLRTLRPLRLLHHNKSMKLIVTTLLESLTGILNMILVLFLVWLMFAILGVSLMKGKMNYCNFSSTGPNYDIYTYHQQLCELAGGTWTTYNMNFENVLQGMLTLFVYSTFEGWPKYSWNFIDATSDGPAYGGSAFFSIFIVVFILIGSFFSIDLFGAVLAFHYDIAQRKSKNKYLSDEQGQWIELQRLILKSKPDFNSIQQPQHSFRKTMWNIAESQKFETFIMVCIICNIFSMAMGYETSPTAYDSILTNINLGFSCVFISECIIKMIAYGINGYFYKSSNQFDFMVVAVSLVDIVLSYSGQSLIKFLSQGPQIARIFRVFRVTRILRLLKQLEGLQKLLQTLIFALPSLMNATLLLLLIYAIFSILACFVFSSYQTGVELDHFQNFSTFHRSFLMLFRLSTGEDWYVIMFDIIDHTSFYSCLFFIFFITIQQYVMMNLFVLIIIEQFEENYINPDNPLNDFTYSEEDFKKQWVQFTRQTKGVKIHERHIPDFYFSTLRPLGFDYKNKLKGFLEQVKKMNQDVTEIDLEVISGKYRIKQKQIAEKDVMQMGIKCDYDGFVYFNELLYYFFKKTLFSSVFERTERARTQSELDKCSKADQILQHEEHQTIKKLRSIKKQQATLTNTKVSSRQLKNVNPMVRHLFVSMCFNSWKKYNSNVQNNLRNLDQYDISSESDSEDYEDDDDEFGFPNPQQTQEALNIYKIDNFYKSRDNLIEVDKKELAERRRQIVPREHTIFQRNQQIQSSQDKQPVDKVKEKLFIEMPNAEDIYKQEFFEDNPEFFKRQISIQKHDEDEQKQELERIRQETEMQKEQLLQKSIRQNQIQNSISQRLENNFLDSLKLRNNQKTISNNSDKKNSPKQLELGKNKQKQGESNQSSENYFKQNEDSQVVSTHQLDEMQKKRAQHIFHHKKFRQNFPPRKSTQQQINTNPSFSSLEDNNSEEEQQQFFKQTNSLIRFKDNQNQQLESHQQQINSGQKDLLQLPSQKSGLLISPSQFALPLVSPYQLEIANHSSENFFQRRPSKFLLENLQKQEKKMNEDNNQD